jgi:zinc protease
MFQAGDIPDAAAKREQSACTSRRVTASSCRFATTPEERMSTLALVTALSTMLAASPAPELPVETYTPVVAVEVRYLVGSAHEVAGKSGFAHLFEHLMFQGSKSFDNEYFAPFEPIGARVNGTTNTDRTNYYEQVPSNYLELALWMESDRMGGLLPVLTKEKLDNQRDVVKNERRQRYENRPYGYAFKDLQNLLYPEGHPYQHTTIGSHEDLTAASLDDVRGFFKTYYAPKNAVLTVVGDFDKGSAKALIEKYFGGLEAGKRAPKPKAEPWVLAEDIVRTEIDTKVKLPKVYLAWHTPALYADGDAAMDILAGVLTQGKTSRLYQPLVYEKKLATDVSAFQLSRHLGSFFIVEATAAPGVEIETLTTALKETLTAALTTAPNAAEMTRVVNGYRKGFFAQLEDVLSRAQLLSTYYHIGGTADFLGKDLGRYLALTPEVVLSAAKTWISDAKHVELAIVGPAKTDAPKAPEQKETP